MTMVSIDEESNTYCANHFQGGYRREGVIVVEDSAKGAEYRSDARYLCAECAEELAIELLGAVRALEEEGN